MKHLIFIHNHHYLRVIDDARLRNKPTFISENKVERNSVVPTGIVSLNKSVPFFCRYVKTGKVDAKLS